MRSKHLVARPWSWRQHVARAITLVGALSCSTDTLDPDRAPVASVVVTPDRLSVGVGATAPLSAALRDAAGNEVLGPKVVWASKDVDFATVSAAGVVTGVSPGPVQIAATAEGKTAIVDVTVNPKAVATIRLTPTGNVGLLVGQTRQMTGEPLDGDGLVLPNRPVTWSSNATAIATVSNTGLITGVAPGGAVVTATSEGKSAVVAVTVSSVPVASVSVTPATSDVIVGQTAQLTAVAKDASGATLPGRVISWSTSDPARATVSSTGLVTGVAAGPVMITATAEGRSGTSALTIKPKPVAAVILSPSPFSVEPGQTRQLTAQVTDDQGQVLTGRDVAYATDNAAVATVSASGLVTGVALGATRITATSEGKTGTADVAVVPVPVATVEVTPAQTNLTIGQTAQLTAVARSASGAVLTGRPVTWTTGASSIATVSGSGLVTGIGNGNAVVFATIEGRTGSAAVNVRQVAVTSVTVTPTSNNLSVGGNVQLTATVRAGQTVLTDRIVGWTSSNTTIATVSTTGRVTGVKAGVVTITATSEGVSGNAFVAVGISSIVVTPNPTTVGVGETRQLTATARDASNATVTGVPFEWTSSATNRATVSASGLVTGVSTGGGTVTISARVGSVSGSSAVTVTAPPVATVTVTPSAPTVNAGQTVQLTATLRDAQGNVLTGRSVSWSSSNTLRATVNGQGLVTTLPTAKNTTVTITATSEGKSGTSLVSIK